MGRFQGQQDIDLDPSGVHQAVEAAAVLRHLHPDAIVSSDLSRALATGRALAEASGQPVTTDPRLRETFAGNWEGLFFADIAARFPREQAGWAAGNGDVRAGGGESRVDVGRRVAQAVTEAADALPPGGTLVAVSHGGAIRRNLCPAGPADRILDRHQRGFEYALVRPGGTGCNSRRRSMEPGPAQCWTRRHALGAPRRLAAGGTVRPEERNCTGVVRFCTPLFLY